MTVSPVSRRFDSSRRTPFPCIGEQIGGIEQQRVVEVRRRRSHSHSGRAAQHVLQLVAKNRLLVEDSRDGGKDEIQLAFRRGPQQIRVGDTT